MTEQSFDCVRGETKFTLYLASNEPEACAVSSALFLDDSLPEDSVVSGIKILTSPQIFPNLIRVFNIWEYHILIIWQTV